MDDRQLKKTLQDMKAPASDENAKKHALNLALAEFDDAQKKNAKNRQGFSLLSRLMGNTNKDKRSESMFNNKKMVYGGMATAMAVVLVVGVSVQQFTTKSYKQELATEATNFNTIKGLPKAYTDLVKERETASQTARSQAEAPIESLTQPKTESATEKPLERWRSINEYRKNQASNQDADMALAQRAPAPATMAMESKAMLGGVASSIAPAPYPIFDDGIAPRPYQDVGRDQFEDFEQNAIKLVSQEPVSTFSTDVDTASYSFVRRQLNNGVLPQKDAVRIEEMINYFDYDYTLPESKEQPFKPSVTLIPSPWKDGNQLIHIGIKGYDIAPAEKPRSNLVFLLDVSGSMNSPDKLPLLKNSMKLLLDTLSPSDTVGIVVYAGAAGTVLEPTKVADKTKILQALDNLSAGGSTAGAEGIRQAYQLAEGNFGKDAVNRVILATDGDFNVGITNREELKDFVERKRETGIFLSVLGFGQGNLNDHMMQELAQNGNGVAAYIDSLNEARKVLVEEASGTLFPIAKDVKIQVEFNPAKVAEYRLIGYETRALNREDFNNDAVDAGDIGAGHTVTAIYEITPVGGPRMVDDSRYGSAVEEHKAETDLGSEYAFLKIRYKLPNEDTSKLITTPIIDADQAGIIPQEQDCTVASDCDPYNYIGDDTLFATAVAGFGQLLKGGKYTGAFSYDDVIALAQQGKGDDEFGYRAEFINLVRLAKSAAALQDTQQ